MIKMMIKNTISATEQTAGIGDVIATPALPKLTLFTVASARLLSHFEVIDGIIKRRNAGDGRCDRHL